MNSSGEDIISTLPDEILSSILSFLPTKYAVGTCILSKKWKSVWTRVPVLDINDYSALHEGMIDEYDKYNEDEDFKNCISNFMSRILNLHRLSCVRKVSLDLLYEYDKDVVEAWIRALILPNIEELNICCSNMCLYNLPPTLFYTCKNLVCLELEHFYGLEVSSVCLPRLKTISLHWVFFADNDSTKKFFSGCPVLIDLCLDRDLWEIAVSLNACPDSLERLTINEEDMLMTEVQPNFDSLPVFHSLTHLAVQASTILFPILERSPILKSLKLRIYDDDSWHTPDCVSECFWHHLETVEFEYFRGHEKEMEMVGYFLKNAMALKMMTMNSGGDLLETEVLKKLHMLPKASNACHITFI